MTGGGRLAISGLDVRFGAHQALDDIGLILEPGELCGLIGPNGAGKTTLFDTVAGFVRPDRGRVELDGLDITRVRPGRRARMGVRRTFQAAELFGDLSVRDNLLVARPREDRGEVEDLLREADLLGWAGHDARRLPAGLQRLVGILRAFAGGPKVLLLDEPGAGLQGDEVGQLAAFLTRTVGQRGVTTLLVDHDMELIRRTCSRVHVMDFGRLIASGSPAEIRDEERVQDAYLGRTVASGP